MAVSKAVLVDRFPTVAPQADWVNARGVLITGATGLIGGGIVPRLIRQSEAKLFCLVRQSDGKSALERLCERLVGEVSKAELRGRIVVIPGDIRKTDLGISAEAFKLMRDEVDLVYHCAATTSFIGDAECWQTNVLGLMMLLGFLKRFPNAPRFVHLGTAAACGAQSNSCIREEPLDPLGEHNVPYTRTKAMAEVMLETLAPADMEVVILRPSMVVPDELISHRTALEAIYPLVIMKECVALPLRGDARLDVVPLSVVLDAMVAVASRPPKQKVYHISAGHADSCVWSDVLKIVEEMFDLPRPIVCAVGEEWAEVRKGLSRQQVGYLRRIRPYFPFINQNLVYDSSRYQAEFGETTPNAFALPRYLPQLLRRVSFTDALQQSTTH